VSTSLHVDRPQTLQTCLWRRKAEPVKAEKFAIGQPATISMVLKAESVWLVATPRSLFATRDGGIPRI
jgi:hypothetical protein